MIENVVTHPVVPEFPVRIRAHWGRQLFMAAKFLVAMTVILGIGYPLVVWGVAQAATRSSADGSLLERNGRVVGSSLIGQDFATGALSTSSANPWFVGRPSDAGTGYDATASGGSNLAADSPELVQQVAHRRALIAAQDGVPAARVPPDAVTASASGLDPDISPAYAQIQVTRVAANRHLARADVQRLVAAHTAQPWLGFLGEDRVNVLELNVAVAGLAGR